MKEKQFLSCSTSYLTSSILYMVLVQPAEGAKDLMSIWKLNNLWMWLFWILCLQRAKKRYVSIQRRSGTTPRLSKNLFRKYRNASGARYAPCLARWLFRFLLYGWRYLKLWGEYKQRLKCGLKLLQVYNNNKGHNNKRNIIIIINISQWSFLEKKSK